MKKRRVLALIFALLLTITDPSMSLAVSTSKGAETTTQSIDKSLRSDFSAKGTDSVGALLADTIDEAAEEEEELEAKNAYINGLTIEGKKATVTYYTEIPADIVVAIYDEETKKMTASGVVKVDATKNTAMETLELKGDMPKYFNAASYMLERESHGPLCKSYTTNLYNRVMQELEDSTIADYPENQVVNLDEEDSTNFAVYSENTKVINYEKNKNQVRDKGNDEYVVSNAKDDFKSLKPGDVFSYTDATGELLIVKVGSVSVAGNVVTITRDKNVKLEEVFDVIKMEGGDSSLKADANQEEETRSVFSDPKAQRAISEEKTKSVTKAVSYEKSGTWANGKAKGSISFQGSVTFTGYAKVYIAWSEKYVEAKVSADMNANMDMNGEFNFEFSPLPQPADIYLCPSLYIAVDPVIVLKFKGDIDTSLKISTAAGFKYDTKTGMTNTSQKPTITFEVNVEGSVYLGIRPDISLVCIDEDIVSATVGPEFGATLKLKYSKELTNSQPDSKHICNACLEGNLDLSLKLNVDLQFAWKSVYNKELVNKTFPNVKSCHYSFDFKEFGWAKCSHIGYRVTATLKDSAGEPVEGANISGSGISGEIQTDSSGKAVFYLPKGSYTVTFTKDDKNTQKKVSIMDEPVSVSAAFDGTSSDSPSSSVEPSDPDNPNPDNPSTDNPAGSQKPTQTIEPDNPPALGTITATGGCGDNAKWELDESGLLLISGAGDITSSPWRDSYSTSVKSVYIRNGITGICDSAFYGCTSLTSARIPGTAKKIGNSAFKNCSSLSAITIPGSVTEIEGGNNGSNGAFQNCTSLTKAVLEEGVTNTGYTAFRGCTSLAGVTLPSTLKSIDGYSFYGCNRLTSITIPDNVTNIDGYAFGGCERLSSLTVPEKVTDIGTGAFSGCASIEEVVISNSVTSIGSSAFADCTKLLCVSIPGNVNTIGNSAFSGCTSLTDVVIANGVTSIGDSAFSGCKSITDVSIGNTVTGIGSDAFMNCSSLSAITIPGSVLSIGYSAFENCTSLESAAIEEGVAQINSRAFYNCTRLGEISIPGSVTEIYGGSDGGNGAFQNCTSLTKAVLGEGVMSTGYAVFRGCTSLAGVTLPSTLKSVAVYSFYGCNRLTSITIPDNVTSIDAYAFGGCERLSSLTVPGKVTDIGDGAFSGCTSIKSVSISNSVTTIGSSAFNGCTSLRKIEIPSKVGTIGSFAFEGCTGLTNVTIAKGVTTIGDSCFSGCTRLASAAIGNTVTGIGSSAFWNCSSLSAITIPGSVLSIGYSAFENCTSLESAVIEDGVAQIRSRAFYNCTKLGEISIPGSVTEIDGYQGGGDGAFQNCTSLTKAVLGEGIMRTGYAVFRGCTSLASVTLPSTLTSIDAYAFYNCLSLAHVYYGGTQEDWDYLVIGDNNALFGSVTIHYTAGSSAARFNAKRAVASAKSVPEGKMSADFSDLAPNNMYIFVAVKDKNAEELLSEDNLLYIAQKTSNAEGALSFDYVPRTSDLHSSYVFTFGIEGEPEPDDPESSAGPSEKPEAGLSPEPSVTPSISPSISPSTEPEGNSSSRPSETPSILPSISPSAEPEGSSSPEPGGTPSVPPSAEPSAEPAASPSVEPSVAPSILPSVSPSIKPAGSEPAGVEGTQPSQTTNSDIGRIMTAGTGKYKVTSMDTVTYIAPKNKNAASVKIPVVVKLTNKSYKVTAVGDNAFKNCKKLKKITIGKNIVKIGKNVFYGAKKLKTIAIKAMDIKSVGKNALKKINKYAVIKVPKNRVKRYKKLFKGKGQPKTVRIR